MSWPEMSWKDYLTTIILGIGLILVAYTLLNIILFTTLGINLINTFFGILIYFLSIIHTIYRIIKRKRKGKVLDYTLFCLPSIFSLLGIIIILLSLINVKISILMSLPGILGVLIVILVIITYWIVIPLLE